MNIIKCHKAWVKFLRKICVFDHKITPRYYTHVGSPVDTSCSQRPNRPDTGDVFDKKFSLVFTLRMSEPQVTSADDTRPMFYYRLPRQYIFLKETKMGFTLIKNYL